MQKNLPKLTMILGGAASGKSKFAENIIFSSDLDRTYIATSQIWDDEMKSKVKAHQAQRGPNWHTIEEPYDLASALAKAPDGHATLIDCATLWLSNHMLAENDIETVCDAAMTAFSAHSDPIIVVTNEVGSGIVPDTKLGRNFRQIQGTFNQRLASESDLVVQVIAGLPRVLKGLLP